MSVSNINVLYDKYCQEDYLCNRTKPKGQLICSSCHNLYEDICAYEAGVAGDIGYSCCSKCHSMEQPYEEE